MENVDRTMPALKQQIHVLGFCCVSELQKFPSGLRSIEVIDRTMPALKQQIHVLGFCCVSELQKFPSGLRSIEVIGLNQRCQWHGHKVPFGHQASTNLHYFASLPLKFTSVVTSHGCFTKNPLIQISSFFKVIFILTKSTWLEIYKQSDALFAIFKF